MYLVLMMDGKKYKKYLTIDNGMFTGEEGRLLINCLQWYIVTNIV